MVIRHDTQFPPAINHGQQTEVIVLDPLGWFLAQTEAIEQLIIEQQLLALGVANVSKDRLTRCEHSLS